MSKTVVHQARKIWKCNRVVYTKIYKTKLSIQTKASIVVSDHEALKECSPMAEMYVQMPAARTICSSKQHNQLKKKIRTERIPVPA